MGHTGDERTEQRHHLALPQRRFQLGAFADVLGDQNCAFAHRTEFVDVIKRDGPRFTARFVFDFRRNRRVIVADRFDQRRGFFPRLVLAELANGLADYFFRLDTDDLLRREI